MFKFKDYFANLKKYKKLLYTISWLLFEIIQIGNKKFILPNKKIL